MEDHIVRILQNFQFSTYLRMETLNVTLTNSQPTGVRREKLPAFIMSTFLLFPWTGTVLAIVVNDLPTYPHPGLPTTGKAIGTYYR